MKPLSVIGGLGALLAPLCAPAQPIYPTDGYTLVDVGTGSLYVGGPDVAPLSELYMDPRVGFRNETILLFNLTGETESSGTKYLNFFLNPLDPPADYSTLHVDAFDAPVLRDPSYYFDTGDEVTSFSTYEPVLPTPFGFPESVDVTSAYNTAIADDYAYLGFVLYVTPGPGSPSFARYYVWGNELPGNIDLADAPQTTLILPPPPPPVPEGGTSLLLLGISLLGLGCLRGLGRGILEKFDQLPVRTVAK
jgi:hypothetical protein